MIAAIRLRPVLSCCFVWNAADGGFPPISTTGGQDKRPGAQGVYGVVVVGFFAYCVYRHRAIHKLRLLISFHFYRATPDFAEAWS